MLESVAANPQLHCRDCGQTMTVIQQPTHDGGYISLVTCWQQSCLLYGVTLSVDQYTSLTEEQLEAYREMNCLSRSKYIRGDRE